MKSEFIPNSRGYDVPCQYDVNGNEKTVCIIVHGFGSSKAGSNAKMLLEKLPRHGVGAVAFDLPSHGESSVDGKYLRLDNCIADLAVVENRARALAPEAEIVYFGSSFGAYITLLYLAGKKQIGRRAFLRSAAVTMPILLNNRLTPERRSCLASTGEFVIDKTEYGYSHDMKLTKGLFDDLELNDVFTFWQEGLAELHMIHGESDDTVPISDARSFAEKFNVPLTVVPNGDHMLSVPGAPEHVLELAVKFLLRL